MDSNQKSVEVELLWPGHVAGVILGMRQQQAQEQGCTVTLPGCAHITVPTQSQPDHTRQGEAAGMGKEVFLPSPASSTR